LNCSAGKAAGIKTAYYLSTGMEVVVIGAVSIHRVTDIATTHYLKSGKTVLKYELDESSRYEVLTRKCRCSEALVVSITNIDGTKANINEVKSDEDKEFVYKVGEVVKVDDFDDNRWEECSTGIHFFITREEAVEY